MDIIAELLNAFEKHRRDASRAVIFWFDDTPDREVITIQQALEENGIHWWELTKDNYFQTKYQIEIADPQSDYLVYARFPKPSDHENPILDLTLYATEFRTDEIALFMNEFGINQDNLYIREFIEKNRIFFNSQRRREKLKKYLPSDPTVPQLLNSMAAVLIGSPSIELPIIVRTLLFKGLDETQNPAYQQLEKFLDVEHFWQEIWNYFGLQENEPGNNRLKTLFENLVYQHLISEIKDEIKESLNLPYKSTLPNTCRVFLEDCFAVSDPELLENYLQELEVEWGIGSWVNQYAVEDIGYCTTFKCIESYIIHKCIEALKNDTLDREKWNSLIEWRIKSSYWAKREPFKSLYRLLQSGILLHMYEEQVNQMPDPRNPEEWFEQYRTFYYKVDQAFRHFMTAREQINLNDMLNDYIESVIKWYENVYLRKIAKHTDRFLDEVWKDNWPIEGVLQQNNFFQQKIRPLLSKSNERIFVIISDALRYEAGEELANRLSQRVNGSVNLSAMQACLPTYTQLGMACLLPGNTLSLDDDKTVRVNHMSSRGMENRERILQQYTDVKVFTYKQWKDMTVRELSEQLKGKRLIYLYHNRIDSIGDQYKTEHQTFEAVSETIHELERWVDQLVRSFQAKRIFITSDHGFLFQLQKIEGDIKTVAVFGDIIDQNRRFAIGRNLSVPVGTVKISLDYLGLDQEAVIAKGLNRLMTQGGGLQFIHGGAMPQEAIVPCIEYREIFGKNRKEEERVDIRVAMREKVLTNYKVKVTFFQEQKAYDERLPREVRMAFYKENKRISNEVTILFDKTGDPQYRHVEVYFTLIEKPYDIGEYCVLKIEDITDNKPEKYREEIFELRLYDVLY